MTARVPLIAVRIILPSTAETHGDLSRGLLLAFGGHTVTKGFGSWLDAGQTYFEAVTIYDVAIPKTAEAVKQARQLGIEAARKDGQAALYFQLGSSPEIIRLDEKNAQATNAFDVV